MIVLFLIFRVVWKSLGLYNLGIVMGNVIKGLFSKKMPKKQCKVVMLGLDGAGKTTILYSLKLGDVLMTIPTIGFNVEELNYKTIKFMVWDVGGQ